jgi:F0F1-type ATP synthase membrane subunit c/vacuolar-type H+-ATPase subunit K
MSRNPHTELERWLAAEAAGDDFAAEEAFGAMFAAMPRLAPPPGFAERVIMAVDREPDTGRATWLWKAALAAAVSLAGLATGLLPLLRWIPIRLPDVGDVVAAAARGLAWLDQWLRTAFDIWGTLARVGGAIGAAAQTPEIATAMMGSALVSALALYSLHHLLVYERRV